MGKRRSLVAPKSKAAPGENNALGGTLDEYFNSKVAYQPGQMLGLSSPSLLKHLLVGSATNNAMQTDKDEDDFGDANATADTNEATQERETRTLCEDARDESVVARSDDKDSVQEPSEKDACESPTKAASEPDAYDEDYESESSSSNADTSVAGMTLSDYLHAKAQDGDETDKEDAVAKPKANKTEPKLAKKQAAAAPSGHKKPPPPALISGMSLDHYLGAVESDDACDDMADSKSPVSKARAVPRSKQPALMLKSSNHISSSAHSMLPAKATNSSNHYSHDQQESMLTPYQRRLKKKNKPKLQPSQQQQPHGPSHGSIGASILLMDAHSSSSGSYSSSSSPLIIAKSMNAGGKDKKKHHYAQPQQHNGSYQQQQPPLPKLQTSASLHSLGHREHESSSDELELEANEKLPPL